jgi:hypothetical protein
MVYCFGILEKRSTVCTKAYDLYISFLVITNEGYGVEKESSLRRDDL